MIIALVVAVLLVCCCCVALTGGLYFGRDQLPLQSLIGPTLTPTLDFKSVVNAKTPAPSDTGLELTVTDITNPLKTAANVKVAPDQKYIAVTVRLKNTKKSGAPIDISLADFKVKGFGGIEYSANPKEVVMDSLLKPSQVAPNGQVTGDLIFQVASNDGELKLYWKNGKTTRTINLEAQK